MRRYGLSLSYGVGLKRLLQDSIGRHVAVAVAVKLCLLATLWWAFVEDASLHPVSGDVGAAILRTAPPAPEPAKESAP
jgi:hypothetical protein